jgi:TP901 family phage tail tape measure protein
LSELIAEARVLVTPDTTTFRSLLTAQLATATKGVVVPVEVTPVVSGTAAGSLTAQKTALKEVDDEERRGASAAAANAAAQRAAAKDVAVHTRQLGQLQRGAASSALSMIGLRGATLASTGPFLAGAAAIGVFAKSLGAFAGFQTELNTFRVTAEATSEQMRQISDLSRQLGADLTLPGVSAADAAQALAELSKAGLSVEDSMDAARGALQLATAAGIDNQKAVELVANALNAFRLNGAEATRVADLLAGASKESQGSIEDMGLALRQSAAAAAQAGISVEDTITLLTQLARAGLTASDAGTSLRVLLIRLINPTDAAAEALDKLNVKLRDQAGNLRPEVFSEIVAKLQQLPKAQQDATLATIAGQDAFRALAITGRDGVGALNSLRDAVEEAGLASEIAGARTQGLAGSAENLKNQLSNAAIALGSQLAPAVQGVADVLSTTIEGASGLAGKINELRTEASKPINFVINLTGGGGGDGGFGDQVTKFFTGTLPQQIEAATGNVTHLRKVFQEASADAEAIKASLALPDIIDQLNQTGASATSLNDVVLRLKDMQEQIKGGSTETAEFRKRFAEFITELQNLSTQPDIVLPIKIPDNLLDALNVDVPVAAREAGSKFGPAFLPSLEESLKAGSAEAFKGGLDPGVAAFKKVIAGLAKDEADSFLAIQPTISAVVDLEFQGASPQQLRAGLERELQKQEDFVAALEKKRAAGGKVSQARIDAAKQAAVATQDKITAIDDAAAAEAERKKDERARAAREAETRRQQAQRTFEQNFLGQQARSRQQQQNRISLAEQTEGVADDIRQQQRLVALINDQIKALRNSTLSEKAKQAAIDALVTARIATTGAIKRLAETDKKQRQEQAAQAAEALANARLELAQTTFDLTGQKAPLERALDAEIKRQIAIKNAAKKGSLAFIQAQTEIRRLLKQRKDLNDELKDEKDKGLTVFDLLKQSADTFNQNAGSLINASQPFAGPTGFTADIAQFLVRRQTPAVAFPTFPGKERDQLETPINDLATALRENTDALLGRNGNTSTAVNRGIGFGEEVAWGPARQARKQTEARSGI